MSDLDLAAVLLIVLIIPNVVASWLLVRLDKSNPGVDALHHRAEMSLLLTTGALIGAGFGLARLTKYQLDGWATLLIVAVLVVVSVPQVHWLWLFSRGMKSGIPDPADEDRQP